MEREVRGLDKRAGQGEGESPEGPSQAPSNLQASYHISTGAEQSLMRIRCRVRRVPFRGDLIGTVSQPHEVGRGFISTLLM